MVKNISLSLDYENQLLSRHYFEHLFYIIRNSDVPTYWGYLALAVCVIGFGSNSLPIKKFKIGDGFFYQLNVCISIWTVGLVANCFRYFPRFYFLPMLGGFLWSSASMLTIPSIKTIGLGMSALISGIVAILVGWANARFGFSGTKAEVPENIFMNYAGVALCAISAVFYIFIKTEQPSADNNVTSNDTNNAETDRLLPRNSVSEDDESEYFMNDVTPAVRQFIGTIITIIAGFLFALSYMPYLYVIDNYENASDNGLDYVFSMYNGILLASVLFFTVYCIAKKNRPYLNSQAILPGFASGWLWGTANCTFLFANCVLSQAVTFPIAGSVPSMIASLYGIFLFKEIKGKRNFFVLIIGFMFTLAGSILCGLSK